MVAVLAVYAPVVWVAREVVPSLGGGGPTAVAVLWIAFTVFMLVRALFMAWRVRGDRWMVLGATR